MWVLFNWQVVIGCYRKIFEPVLPQTTAALVGALGHYFDLPINLWPIRPVGYKMSYYGTHFAALKD